MNTKIVMVVMAALIVPMIMSNAYAQTATNMQTIDMSPLIWVIISIIPVFIVLTLLDKLLDRVKG
jgi:hypothetical protein